MEHLKLIAEKFAELSIDKRFPIIHWLTGCGIRVDILEPYDTFTVDFGVVMLIYVNREWTIHAKESFIFNHELIEETGREFQDVLDRFIDRLPELKARHIVNTQKQLIELQEELQQVAA